MHRIKMLTFYLVLLTSLIGCSSTGGTIGGLIPAPKFTKGDLSDGIYTAQDKSFIVNFGAGIRPPIVPPVELHPIRLVNKTR
jgi:major membrane immunogen (membrane-anchored lipoprotein)